MLKGHSVKITSYFYFSVFNSNSRQCPARISKAVIIILKLKYSGKVWHGAGRKWNFIWNSSLIFTHCTNHKEHLKPLLNYEMKRKDGKCAGRYSSHFHMFTTFCSARKMKDGLNQTISSVPRKPAWFPPFSVGK